MRAHYFSRLCKRMTTLLEPFEDFDLTIRSWSFKRKYKVERKIRPIHYPVKIPLRIFRKLVRLLNQRYPEHNYRLATVTLFSRVDGRSEVHRNFIDQAHLVYTPPCERTILRQLGVDGRLRKTRYHVIRRGECCIDNPPVYYDPRAGRFFVPASYFLRHKRLTNSVIYYRLRSLGVV